MSRKIIGVTVGSPLPKPNLKQTDPTKGDYVKGKDVIPSVASDIGAYTKEETDQAIQLAVNNGGVPTDSNGILLLDRATGEQYVLYVENGKLSMEVKIAEVITAICGMTLCGQTVCGGV